MNLDDAYTELGLRPGAAPATVKAAWRRMASRWHPDRNPSPEAVLRMQRLNTAYEHICQQQQGGELANTRGGRPRSGASSRTEGAGNDSGRTRNRRPPPADEANTEAPRGRRSGNHSSHSRPRPEPPPAPPRPVLAHAVALTLEEAAHGCIKTLRGRIREGCATCGGQGHHLTGHDCAECDGSGQVRERLWYGWLAVDKPCPACEGSGLGRLRCTACDGVGQFAERDYQLQVRIPPGVRAGDNLHVPGAAPRPHAGADGAAPAADVSLDITLLPHALLTLDADGQLRCTLPVDALAWAAGHWALVPTLDGPLRMRLHPQHLNYRLRGQGFPAQQSAEPGDLLVTLQPCEPSSLPAEHDDLLEQLLALRSQSAGPLQQWHERLHTWLDTAPDTPPNTAPPGATP